MWELVMNEQNSLISSAIMDRIVNNANILNLSVDDYLNERIKPIYLHEVYQLYIAFYHKIQCVVLNKINILEKRIIHNIEFYRLKYCFEFNKKENRFIKKRDGTSIFIVQPENQLYQGAICTNNAPPDYWWNLIHAQGFDMIKELVNKTYGIELKGLNHD
jgi:hypothetical protein